VQFLLGMVSTVIGLKQVNAKAQNLKVANNNFALPFAANGNNDIAAAAAA